MIEKIILIAGVPSLRYEAGEAEGLSEPLHIYSGKQLIGVAGQVTRQKANQFDIKQPVFFADLYWQELMALVLRQKISFRELPKQQPVQRDLALVVPKQTAFGTIESAINAERIGKLKKLELFDLFESDKLGAGKKSLAVRFTFLDEEKTMTDKEIDSMMQKIMGALEKETGAEIRK